MDLSVIRGERYDRDRQIAITRPSQSGRSLLAIDNPSAFISVTESRKCQKPGLSRLNSAYWCGPSRASEGSLGRQRQKNGIREKHITLVEVFDNAVDVPLNRIALKSFQSFLRS